jgi:hypothetical protein
MGEKPALERQRWKDFQGIGGNGFRVRWKLFHVKGNYLPERALKEEAL